MDVLKISPRGYCYGVVDAIQMAKQVAKDPSVPKPVYILGQIVHNRHAVKSLEAYDIVPLDGEDRMRLLEEVDSGTVVFTAHGVSPAVKERAKEKGLHCVDATCPDVQKTHDLVKRLVADGYEVIYIGKKGHPEPEGVLGEAPEHVHLISDESDLEQLQIDSDQVAVSTQTTLSKWDTERLIELVQERYPGVEVYNEICLATQLRQEAAVSQSKDVDLVLVVGDERSNNSNRLVQVVRELAGRPAHLVDSAKEIQTDWLEGVQRVAVTAGSSTPSQITREVIRHLEELNIETTPRVPAQRKVPAQGQSSAR